MNRHMPELRRGRVRVTSAHIRRSDPVTLRPSDPPPPAIGRALRRVLPITVVTVLAGFTLPLVAPPLTRMGPACASLYAGLSIGLLPALGVILLLLHNRWVAKTRR